MFKNSMLYYVFSVFLWNNKKLEFRNDLFFIIFRIENCLFLNSSKNLFLILNNVIVCKIFNKIIDANFGNFLNYKKFDFPKFILKILNFNLRYLFLKFYIK